MKTPDFSPLFRATVGFDRLFDMLDASATARPDWPPYNIEKSADDQYRISMAIAGFAPEEIELTQQGSTLLVSGQKKATDRAVRDYLHQGLAHRSFRQTFNLADHVKVTSANVEHGMLSIELAREIPEQLKPRRIEVQTSAGQKLSESRPKLVEQDTKAA